MSRFQDIQLEQFFICTIPVGLLVNYYLFQFLLAWINWTVIYCFIFMAVVCYCVDNVQKWNVDCACEHDAHKRFNKRTYGTEYRPWR